MMVYGLWFIGWDIVVDGVINWFYMQEYWVE